MPTDKEKFMKLQVNASKTMLKQIEEIKKMIDAGTRTEVIRASLKYFHFVVKEKEKGDDFKIVVKDSKGREKEIIF